MIDLFENITDKNVFTVGKPNNYAYEFILKKFNVKRENTLMAEDTYKTDIAGAISSGIKAVWVNTGNKLSKIAAQEKFLRVDLIKHYKIIIKATHFQRYQVYFLLFHRLVGCF